MSSPPSSSDTSAALLTSYATLRTALSHHHHPTSPPLPSPSALSHAQNTLPSPSSPTYLQPHGTHTTLTHLLTDLLPAFNSSALSSRYYAFVTGSAHPAAEFADNLVSAVDNNAQVHIAGHSISGEVEEAALGMVVHLLELDGSSAEVEGPDLDAEGGKRFPGRIFTTGATAGNIMGLACGREAVLRRRLVQKQISKGAGELGMVRACVAAGVEEIQVLTSLGHSSLSKAASVVGLGREGVKDVGVEGEPWRLDLAKVERELEREADGVVSIVVVGAGEVNSGRFATNLLDMPKLRSLADRYGAWIHVDGAFGILARVLPKTDEFMHLHAGVAGLELADSIGTDAHKMLNVPYDSGIFLCRDLAILTSVFQNPNAAYLNTTTTSSSSIPSALNIGLENSRRLRALPVYALLHSEGRPGISAMVARMVRLARHIASFIRTSPHYEWLPQADTSPETTFIIVLFRARNSSLNDVLVDRINASNKIYVSGTQWAGRKAVRIAVSSWRVDVDSDLAVVQEVLTSVASSWSS